MAFRSATILLWLVTSVAACDSTGPDNASENVDEFVQSEGFEIHYLVSIPGGDGPFPAVVLGQGSGDIDANQSRNLSAAREFIDLNYIVARYDKRGTGKSSGELINVSTANSSESIPSLASDMSAVLRRLLERPDVDPEWVGLYGSSQATWYMPLVARDNPDVDFMIVNSGGLRPVGEQNRFEELTRVQGRPYDEAQDELDEYDGPLGFDQRPILADLDIRMLYLWGLEDGNLPLRTNLAELPELRTLGANISLITYPAGTHGLQETDFWADIRGWLSGGGD